jgi:hypothetical protein
MLIKPKDDDNIDILKHHQKKATWPSGQQERRLIARYKPMGNRASFTLWFAMPRQEVVGLWTANRKPRQFHSVVSKAAPGIAGVVWLWKSTGDYEHWWENR